MPVQFLLDRVKALKEMPESVPLKLIKIEIELLTHEVLSYVSQWADIPGLEKRLRDQIAIDLGSLRRAVRILRGEELGEPFAFGEQLRIVPLECLEQLEEFIGDLESQTVSASQGELLLRLEITGDAYFDDLLICAARRRLDLDELLEMVRAKLDFPDEQQLAHLWGLLVAEFSKSRRKPSMELDPDILPRDFLTTTHPDNARQRIAEYLVRYKPRLILQQLNSGRISYPKDLPGIARMLAWQDPSAVGSLKPTEVSLAHSISRLIVMWKAFISNRIVEIAHLLRLSPEGRLFAAPELQELKERPPRDDSVRKALFLFELQKIVETTAHLARRTSELEEILRRYKLGLEVMLPHSRKYASGKGELFLQKELCQFLLHHGIFSYGTKFGQSEIDLLTEEAPDIIVIEAKLLRIGSRPTAMYIKRALIQLQSYIDQGDVFRRGVLLIYNLSDTLILEPHDWIHGRFRILPINLLSSRPSTRKKSLVVTATSGPDLLDIQKIDT